MIAEFLTFVDERTEFGKVHISGRRLFELFVASKGLSDNVAYGFRLRLQRKGIL